MHFFPIFYQKTSKKAFFRIVPYLRLLIHFKPKTEVYGL